MDMQKIAVIFPGQGSHFVGMYKNLYDNYDIVRQTIQEAEQVSRINLTELCFKGPLPVLSRAENAHLAILSFGVAAFRVFVSETGIVPDFCAGHSLGEYAALVCAGVLSFSDALKLVRIRTDISRKVQKSVEGGMTIIDGIASPVVEEVCKKQQSSGKKVYLSCYNSETQTAISGTAKDLEETENLIRRENGTITPLFNSAPFHCPLMEAGSEALKEAISEIQFYEPRYPVLSNYTGIPYSGTHTNVRNLVSHLTNTVKWNHIMNYLEDKQVDIIVDLSARNIFDNILQDRKGFTATCFGIKGERDHLFEILEKDFGKEKTDFVTKSILAAVSTPNQNSEVNLAVYEKLVGENYETLFSIKRGLAQGRLKDTKELKTTVFHALKKILEYKVVDETELLWWMSKIADETATTYENLF
jgi:[acyl-carrier-protein] S-malonyltransferase